MDRDFDNFHVQGILHFGVLRHTYDADSLALAARIETALGDSLAVGRWFALVTTRGHHFRE